jgi:hypothetical protein
MRNYAAKLSCALALLVAGCSGPATSPAAGEQQPTAVSSSAPASTVRPASPTFALDQTRMMAALPTAYRGHAMGYPFEGWIDLQDIPLRDDLWAGQQVTPGSCRMAIRSVGRPVEGIEDVRSDTPAVMKTAELKTPAGEGAANVRLYELTGDEAVRYQLRAVQPAPECREFTAGRGDRGSIVERVLPEFGPASRYNVRTYPRSGRAWTERIVLFQTPRFSGEVRVYGTDNTERDFLAFARQVRTRALRTLG